MTPYEIKQIAEHRFEVRCGAYGKDLYRHRLFDTSDIRERSKTKDGVRSYAHLPKNPGDYIVTVRGMMFYAEIKGTASDRFTFSHIEPSQMAAMKQQLAAGGLYFVFINQVVGNEWFCVPAAFFVENHVKGSPVKSASLINLKKDFYCGTNPFARLP